MHLFHTKFDRVWEYVNKFSDWIPYEHRVKGKVDVGEGYKIVPIPPSQETVNTLFNAGVNSEADMEAWLDARRSVNENPKNGEESALTRSGKELYEAIFKYYTKKQWDKFPEELDASVLARIPAGKGMGGVLWGGTVMWDGGVRSCYRTRSFSNHVASPWLVCFFFFFFFFFKGFFILIFFRV